MIIMCNILFIVSSAGLIVLVLRSLMLSKNAFTYSKYILYTYCIGTKQSIHADYKICPDSRVSTLRGSSIQCITQFFRRGFAL